MWEAQAVLREIQQRGMQPGLANYNALIWGLCRGDHFEVLLLPHYPPPAELTPSLPPTALQVALEMFEEMRGAGVEASGRTYSLLLRGCARALRPEIALSLLRGMREEGLEPSPVDLQLALSCLLKRAIVTPFSLDGSIAQVLGEMRGRAIPPSIRNSSMLRDLSSILLRAQRQPGFPPETSPPPLPPPTLGK